MTHDPTTADPVPPQTAHKPDTTPTGDGDTTTARRKLLALLLDRIERGALLPTEVPLLRACVTAEQGEASSNVIIRAKIAEAELEALRGGVREWGADPTNLQNMYAQLAMRTRQWDGTKAELAAARTANAEAWQLIEMMKDLIGAERQIVINAMGHREDQGIRFERCDHCGADHLAELDEAIQDADKRYGDAFPATADGPSRPGRLPDGPAPTPAPDVACTCNPRGACDAPCDAKQMPIEPARCSPLINPNCPGHIGPPYCDRAPSNPEPVATCTALYTGETGETWHCTLNAGHNGDHVQAEDGSNYWNDHVATYPAGVGSEPQQ